MQTIDLYRSYLGQTAIFKAASASDIELRSISIIPNRIANEGFDAERVEGEIGSRRTMGWLEARNAIGFSITDASIKAYVDGWTDADSKLTAKRMTKFKEVMPGAKMTLTDSDGTLHIVGIIHGQTWALTFGRVPVKTGGGRRG